MDRPPAGQFGQRARFFFGAWPCQKGCGVGLTYGNAYAHGMTSMNASEAREKLDEAKAWASARCAELDEGKLHAIVHALRPHAGSFGLLAVWGGYRTGNQESGGGPKAAVHSGPGSALGSHPCVALSSCRVIRLYGPQPSTRGRSKRPLWPKAINPGVWGEAPIK